MEAQVQTGKVRVKILKHVGQWSPGDVVDVDKEIAKFLCAPTKINDGNGLIEHRKAMTIEEAKKLEETPIDISRLTQKEMNELGLKNIVQTPKDAEITRIIAKKKKDKSEDLVMTPGEFLGDDKAPAAYAAKIQDEDVGETGEAQESERAPKKKAGKKGKKKDIEQSEGI